MGVTLTAFVDGTTMSALAVNTNMLAIRNWLNGNIATTDLVDDTIPTRAFRRMDHIRGIDNRSQLQRSVGVTGSTVRGTQTSNVTSRAYACLDSHGIAAWDQVGTMATLVRAEDAGKIETVFEWWCWQIQSAQTTIETLNAADFRLAVNGVGISSTVHTLFDSATDPAGSSSGGPYNYPARNFQALWQQSVNAGWVNVELQIKIADHGTTAANRADNYGLVIVGARNRHVEYWRK